MDFAENIGNLNIGVDRDSADMVASMADAVQKISDTMQKSGETNEAMLKSMKEMNQVSLAMTVGLQMYRDLSSEVNNNIKGMLESYKTIADLQLDRLEKEKAISGEREKQAASSKYMSIGGKAVNDPIGTAGGFISEGVGSVPGIGNMGKFIIGAVTAAVKEGLAIKGETSDIERTAGQLGGINQINMARIAATAMGAAAPHYDAGGKGIATKEQVFGAGQIMYGLGGIRGGGGTDVADILEVLPKKAYTLGMSLEDAAKIMARLNRVSEKTPEALIASFDEIAEAARNSGEKAEEYGKFVAETSVKTAAYGVTVSDVNEVLKGNYHLIREEKMAREEYVNITNAGKRMGMSNESINAYIADLGKAAENTNQKVSDLEPAASSLQKAFVSISHDASRSFSDASSTTTKFADALKKDISEGTLTKMVEYLVAGVGMTKKEMEHMGSYFVQLGRDTKVSSDKIAGWHEQMTTGTREMFGDPKEAAYVAGASLRTTAKMFDEGTLSVGDWNTIVRTQMDVLGDTGTGATGKFVKLANIVETTNTRMSELATWTEQLSRVNRQYGYDQTSSTNMLVGFTQGLRDGMISLADIQTVMKGPGGASEASRAMVTQQLAASGGSLGKAFSKTGVLGGIDILLPDLMTYLGSGKEDDWTPALSKAFGTGPMNEKERSSMQGQIGGAFKGIVRGTIQGAGSSDIESADFLAAYKRLSASLFGTEITAVGKELDKLVKIQLGDMSTGELAKGVTSHDKKKTEEDLIKAYGKFPQHVDTFGKGAKELSEAATAIKEAFKTPPSRTTPGTVVPLKPNDFGGEQGRVTKLPGGQVIIIPSGT